MGTVLVSSELLRWTAVPGEQGAVCRPLLAFPSAVESAWMVNTERPREAKLIISASQDGRRC